MLHQRIPRLTTVEKEESAFAVYSGRKWSNKRKRWLYIYTIYPPKHKPFLPSDEALLTMIGHLPETAIVEINRFPDRDYVQVFGLKRGIFTTRADFVSRTICRQFLSQVGEASSAVRKVRESTIDATEQFLTECGFANIEWDGHQVIAHTPDNKRYEGSRVRGGTYWKPFRDLYRTCKAELPFAYGAAS